MNDEREEFLRHLWKDIDRGSILTIEEYRRLFPGAQDLIEEEFNRLRQTKTVELPGSKPTRELEGLEGRTIGRYCITGPPTIGGMGALYYGTDPELARRVVLKTIRFTPGYEDEAIKRLRREARIGGRLAHEGICPVLDFISQSGQLYVVMPFVEGATLADRIKAARQTWEHSGGPRILRPPRPDERDDMAASQGGARSSTSGSNDADPAEHDLRRVIRLMEQIIHAVHVMHEQGVVHRDLKPSNIIIKDDGSPVLLDFGLALDMTSDSVRLTDEGRAVGTPLYMSPEQVEGRVDQVDGRSDVYALGVILYELVTLETPFRASTKEAVFRLILRADPVPPRRLNRSLPRDLEAVCLKAMSTRREDRYASPGEFAEDLRNIRLLRPTVARPPSSMRRCLFRFRRHPWATGLGAASLVLAVMASLSWWDASAADKKQRRLGAIARVVVASSLGQVVNQDDLSVFEEELGPEMAARFRTEPNDPSVVSRIAELLNSIRGTSDILQLESPRGVIVDAKPMIVLSVAPKWWSHEFSGTVYLDEHSAGTRVVEVPFEGKAVDGRIVVPITAALPPGRTYSVWLTLKDELFARTQADPMEDYLGRFDLKPLAYREACLELPVTGQESIDRLVQAASLLEYGLALDARRILADDVWPDDDPCFDARRLLLLLEVTARLNDVEAFGQLKHELAERSRQCSSVLDP